jgi:flagellar basal body-associated protein FliL
MADYQRIDCKCGHNYLTKEMVSRCPKCGKTNYTLAGGLVYILIILAIVIFVALLIGSAVWSYYARKEKWKWYHFVGSMILGSYGLYVFYEMDRTDHYPALLMVSYVCNGSGVLLALYTLIENLRMNSGNGNLESKEGTGIEKSSLKTVLIFIGVVVLTFIGFVAYKQFESKTTVQDAGNTDTFVEEPVSEETNTITVDSTALQSDESDESQNSSFNSYWGKVFESSDMGKLERITFGGTEAEPEINYQSDGGALLSLNLNEAQSALYFTQSPNTLYKLTDIFSDQFTLINPDGRSQVFQIVMDQGFQE